MATKSRSVTEEQFESLLMALAGDVVDAHIFWGQAEALRAQLEQWPEVYTEGFAFWAYTLQAHQRTALSCLGRVFDQEQSNLHLRSPLMLTRDHSQYFGKGAAARRQPDDPFAQWLPEDATAPVRLVRWSIDSSLPRWPSLRSRSNFCTSAKAKTRPPPTHHRLEPSR